MDDPTQVDTTPESAGAWTTTPEGIPVYRPATETARRQPGPRLIVDRLADDPRQRAADLAVATFGADALRALDERDRALGIVQSPFLQRALANALPAKATR